eukprot:JZ554583.1.p2 GENE.JZ554583.1~~JZ554583.1.p2  ORF type:complete len:99 (-),score=2.59 JZ554583.1:349-645(-)
MLFMHLSRRCVGCHEKQPNADPGELHDDASLLPTALVVLNILELLLVQRTPPSLTYEGDCVEGVHSMFHERDCHHHRRSAEPCHTVDTDRTHRFVILL